MSKKKEQQDFDYLRALFLASSEYNKAFADYLLNLRDKINNLLQSDTRDQDDEQGEFDDPNL